MFLLISGRHVGAHLGGHQHGVSIQISINLGKTFLRISCIRKIAVTWILAGVFGYLPSLYFQILGLIYWTVLIFILIYFKNQQYCVLLWYWTSMLWWIDRFDICQNKASWPYRGLKFTADSDRWPSAGWIAGSCLVNLLKTGQDCSEAS